MFIWLRGRKSSGILQEKDQASEAMIPIRRTKVQHLKGLINSLHVMTMLIKIRGQYLLKALNNQLQDLTYYISFLYKLICSQIKISQFLQGKSGLKVNRKSSVTDTFFNSVKQSETTEALQYLHKQSILSGFRFPLLFKIKYYTFSPYS